MASVDMEPKMGARICQELDDFFHKDRLVGVTKTADNHVVLAVIWCIPTN